MTSLAFSQRFCKN